MRGVVRYAPLLVEHRVKVRMPGVHTRGADSVGLLLRQLDRSEASTGLPETLESLVVLGRDKVPCGAAVAGHGNGFALGQQLVAPKIPSEFGSRDDVFHLYKSSLSVLNIR